MRTALRTLVLGAALLSAPLLESLSAHWVAPLAIAVGVLASATLHGRLDALAVAAGAAAALGLVGLSWSPALAGAAFVLAASAPRALRVIGRRGVIAHSVLALTGGALAAAVVARFGGEANLPVRAASLVVGGLLASLPTLVAAEDPIARALQVLADELTGDVSASLSRAASLRRRVAGSELLAQLPHDTLARIDAGWDSLLHTATRRAALGAEIAVGASLIDQRVSAHVDVLERIHAAAAERVARTLGLDDRGIAAAKLEREGIEAEVRALAELTDAPPA